MRKASDTHSWMMSNIRKMTAADMDVFAATYPAFHEALVENVFWERSSWVAGGASEAAADEAARTLWERGIKAARLEVAAREWKKFSAADIGWITRRRRQDRAARVAKEAAKVAKALGKKGGTT